jgi:hypothetical protein
MYYDELTNGFFVSSNAPLSSAAETRLESRIGLRGMAIHAHYDRTFPQEKVHARLQRRESIDDKTNL